MGLPVIRPSSFKNAITEPVKVMAPIAAPSDISNKVEPCIEPGDAEAEALRRVKRARRDEHRGKADQSVEEGDKLGHRRHLNGCGRAIRRWSRRSQRQARPQKREESRRAIDRGAWSPPLSTCR